ncbi:hypothetical protein HYX12_03860 [Candidatus Woesearchaeota archaeon]|nr:hypothetical protein [Candidatus Woesearchaeota archaeon]
MKRLLFPLALAGMLSCGEEYIPEFIYDGTEGHIATVEPTEMPPPEFKFTGEVETVERLHSEIKFTSLGIPSHKEDVLEPPQKTLEVLVCLMDWGGQESMQSILANLMAVNEFYRENSFNNLGFRFQVVKGPSVKVKPTNIEDIVMAGVSGCDSSIDYRNVDAVLIYPGLLDGQKSKFESTGLTSANELISTKEGTFFVGSILIGGTFNWRTISHEFGHILTNEGYPLAHANALDCSGESYSSQGCLTVDYGNYFDIMGLAIVGGHMSGHFKNILGWCNDTPILESGTYPLDSLENPSENPQVLKLQLHGLCIDYRLPMGFDDSYSFHRALFDLEESGETIDYNRRLSRELQLDKVMPVNGGLFIYECEQVSTSSSTNYGHTTALVNMLPSLHNSGRSYMHPGISYFLPSVGISEVFFQRTGRSTASVTIRF